jgi:hypothetical protein
LIFQFVRDFFLGAAQSQRGPNHGKGPLGDLDRLANFGDFARRSRAPDEADV